MIPFSPPRIDQAVIDEVVDTLRSGWITTGPKTKLFEKNLSAYNGAPATLCLNSATAGLELMLRWFGVQAGDEVILPAYTYSATANVVVHCGARPVFVDVGEDFNIDPQCISAAITGNTKVIMPVDFGGWPCDYDSIMSLAEAARNRFIPRTAEQEKLGRILVLSDAAHSLGARYKGRRTGTLADLSVFSFHAVKNLTTAEGGALSLNLPSPFDNSSLYKMLCVRILHGQDKDALAKTQKGNWRYDIVEAGYKMNMTDILASIGLVELARYEQDTLVRRRAICEAYNDALKNKSWAHLPELETRDRTSCCHLYPLRIRDVDEARRDDILRRIFDRDVSVNVHFLPLPKMSFYQGLGYEMTDYPQTWKNYVGEISLPVYYDLTDEQVQTVVKAVVQSVEEALG